MVHRMEGLILPAKAGHPLFAFQWEPDMQGIFIPARLDWSEWFGNILTRLKIIYSHR